MKCNIAMYDINLEIQYVNLDMVTCRISSCVPGVNKVHLLIILERRSGSI